MIGIVPNQIARWVLASLFLTAFVSSAGQEIFAQNRINLKTLISVSCHGQIKCVIEGRHLLLQGQPINKIIQGMCSLQMNNLDKSSCYSFAYRLAPLLGKGEIQRGYERIFSWTTVKGYLHFVRRTCDRYVCLAGENRCEVQAASCWQKLTLNFKREIEGILQDMISP